MGTYASSFRNDDGPALTVSHPSKADWITAHASASGLAIVEVERLWFRFQQLGCSEEGVLGSDVLAKPPASTDIFVKNILTTLRNPRDPDYSISFITFLNAMTWAENASNEKKVRAIFHLINNGHSITKDIIIKVLKRLYPSEIERTITRTAEVVMSQMDAKQRGYIDEEQFTAWVMRLPEDKLNPLLSYEIIPGDINEEAHRAFTNMTQYTPRDPSRGGPSPLSISKQIPTDAKLKEIALKIHRKDWQLVANKLGITSQDIQQIQTNVGRDTYAQCFEMLKFWRSQAGTSAYGEVLEKALTQSNMNDAAMLLQP